MQIYSELSVKELAYKEGLKLYFWISDRHVSVRERPGVPESGRQLDVSMPARGQRMPRQPTGGYYFLIFT